MEIGQEGRRSENGSPKEDKTPHLPVAPAGLNELLHGGLVRPPSREGIILLIKGRPGTGKTTLALQIAGMARKWKEPLKRDDTKVQWKKALLYSCEQLREDLKTRFQELFPEAGPKIDIIGSDTLPDGMEPSDP